MLNVHNMLQAGDRFYVQIPNQSGERILHPATVVEHEDSKFTAEVKVSSPPLEAGKDIIIFFELEKEFMQQSGQLDMVKPSDVPADDSVDNSSQTNSLAGTAIGFQLVGDPISAENRQCYRVSTVMVDLTATLDGEANCHLLDISSNGFSLVSSREHTFGTLVEVTLEYGLKNYSGKARIQSVIEHPRGVFRYGLYGIEDKNADNELGKALRVISMDIQRLQLRRRTGSD